MLSCPTNAYLYAFFSTILPQPQGRFQAIEDMVDLDLSGA
jgi:hypothetical protein